MRTRFFPKSRVGQGLVSLAPWINVVLLAGFFLFLDSKIVLQPGVIVQLPEGQFTEGSRLGLVAVVLFIGAPGKAGQEIVFFDDERFLVERKDQMESLKHAFALRSRERKESTLVIQADQHVSHGTVMTLMNMALEVGLQKVNVAERSL